MEVAEGSEAAVHAQWREICGFGRVDPVRARVVAAADADTVAAALRDSRAGVIARGSGCSYGDAAQLRDGTVVDVTPLRGVLHFDRDEGLLKASAGTTMRELLGTVLPAGWMLPVVPGTGSVTLGGAIASDIHGKNHHQDGSFAQHVTAATLCRGDGEVSELHTGDPELAATAGGMGLTGVLIDATIRLMRCPGGLMAVDIDRAPDLDATLALLAEGNHRYSIAWLDLLNGTGLARGVVLRADHQPGPIALPRPPRVRITRTPPVSPLRPAVMRLVNELHWRRMPRSARARPEPLVTHLFPLDALSGWNRLYGPGGLLQYQTVLPTGSERVLQEILERVWAARAPVFLTTLKQFGPASGSPLSFPLAGHTLALDFPAQLPMLGSLLPELDEVVADAGGRVYLSKDRRLAPETLAAMYPRLAEWREVRAALDPEERIRSDLGARLGLCPTTSG